jgi:hypothetical protein
MDFANEPGLDPVDLVGQVESHDLDFGLARLVRGRIACQRPGPFAQDGSLLLPARFPPVF